MQRIRKLPEPDPRAIEAYTEIVGTPRDVASRYIMEKLALEDSLRSLLSEYGASQPSDVLTAMRTAIYSEMVADPKVLRENQWPYTVAVLRMAKKMACHTGLATMSQRQEALHVLRSLHVERFIDLIVTAEDVKHGKQDPEIYLVATQKLKVAPAETLALEDSVNGVRAALAAGTNVIAIATSFTNCALHAEDVVNMLGDNRIVHKPDDVAEVVRRRIVERIAAKQPPYVEVLEEKRHQDNR